MSFSNLAQTDGVESTEEDRLGGGSYLAPSGAEEYKVEMAYTTVAQSGAIAVNLILNGPHTLRFTEYVTSGTAKGCKTSYTKKSDGKEYDLPGFQKMNGLAMLTAGKPLSALTPTDRVIKLYDYDAGKEVDTKVKAFEEMLNTKVIAGILHKIVNKQDKNDATGKYEDINEMREINEIDKFFCAREEAYGKTLTEIKGNSDAEFLQSWKEKNNGVTRDLYKEVKGGGAPGAPAAAKAPTKSIFED